MYSNPFLDTNQGHDMSTIRTRGPRNASLELSPLKIMTVHQTAAQMLNGNIFYMSSTSLVWFGFAHVITSVVDVITNLFDIKFGDLSTYCLM